MPLRDKSHLQHDPRLKGRYFYALPLKLLNALKAAGAMSRIEMPQQHSEFELATEAESLNCVGFRNGVALMDSLLLPPLPLATTDPVSASYFKELGVSPTAAQTLLGRAEQKIAFDRETWQGYCGWLFSNSEFLSEFTTLLSQMPELIDATVGDLSPTAPSQSVPPEVVRTECRDTEPLQAFCTRWRLNGVRGPRTVDPLRTHEVSPFPALDAIRAESVGRFSFTPDTARIPPRDELRTREEESIRGTARSAGHLAEWTQAVDSSSQGKKTISRWARWYRFQHYWNVLDERHSPSLNRLQKKVLTAFATWLAIDPTTLIGDYRSIRKRLRPTIPSA